MQITGILVYEDLEGGFWGIVGNDGSRYELDHEPPADVAEPGLMVEAELEQTGSVTIRQWGTPVRIVKITRANL
jgi:hypothetical protein